MPAWSTETICLSFEGGQIMTASMVSLLMLVKGCVHASAQLTMPGTLAIQAEAASWFAERK